ncbi:hypothetical protein [Granulicella tundricola]|uniref:Uncharacterized protein n=1 Tax=Granulicella tundricola (strain ATCC BAA-1859 / DSM 23138 / MP5ACTX9) TaxID=1198114 RepID=E8X4R9_GRATM|nr:hypothetical protein [Granulicella tundricola]ADW70558.1 hypothetical protein AciX9_3554 [Granulicella tundricola MP5ACTX9]
MNLKKLAAPALAIALLTTASAFAQGYGGPPPPPQGYGQGPGGPGGWEAPPPEFQAAQARGYHDGVEGARKDFENHRPPNVNNRDEYRHPGFIPGPERRDYKFGFRRGYDNAVRHMYGPGPGGPRPY